MRFGRLREQRQDGIVERRELPVAVTASAKSRSAHTSMPRTRPDVVRR
jgi:hypothetical protein